MCRWRHLVTTFRMTEESYSSPQFGNFMLIQKSRSAVLFLLLNKRRNGWSWIDVFFSPCVYLYEIASYLDSLLYINQECSPIALLHSNEMTVFDYLFLWRGVICFNCYLVVGKQQVLTKPTLLISTSPSWLKVGGAISVTLQYQLVKKVLLPLQIRW